MRRAYSLLLICATPALLVYFWWRGRKDADYRLRWRERFGRQRVPAAFRGGVLLHCASVGEVIAARPLVERMLGDPRWRPLVLSCTTPTGSRMILDRYGDRVGHGYFPLDLPGATRRFLDHWRPRAVLLLERELWPNFLHHAQARGIPVALVNARLSVHSAAGYQRWRGLMEPALASLRLVCAEDAATAGRFRAMGVRADRIRITGNIKSDIRSDPALAEKIADVRRTLGARPVLTAGSTHAGEDEALLAAFRQHLATAPQTLLMLVPRHPERFDAVAALLRRSGLRFARRSLGEPLADGVQVLLGDSLGELMLWYGVSDASFVGGSLIERGGHNPLEVMCLRRPVIAGPHTANFGFIYAALENCHGLLPAVDAFGVFEQFRTVLQDREAAQRMAGRAYALYERLAGATERTLEALSTRAMSFDASHYVSTLPPATPSHGVVQDGHDTVWFDPQCFSNAGSHLFDPAWWRQHGTHRAAGTGRGGIHRVADAQRRYLLRHYFRGGFMATISRDRFLAQAAADTRALREFALLAHLRKRGLPVPRACAARCTRHGIWYRADILVEVIPDADDLAQLLAQRPIVLAEWTALGRAVRQLHDAGVYHSDLNCHNLMLDTRGKAWIVDFDKCGFQSGTDWKQANLARLLRSLRKELRLNPRFRWREDDWQHFIGGYKRKAG